MILNVLMKDKSYDVIIEKGVLTQASQHLDLNRKVLVVTDDGVPSIYIETVLSQCEKGFVYTIKQGEGSKNLKNYENIIDYMIEKGFVRTDCIIAIGGGVVGDLAGFVSATYMRGICFYNIPTTLLSQVDSSIGGKTAIDKGGIKNIVGAFYPPQKVLIDPLVLKTLDKRQLHAGLVEAYKMGLTSDRSLVDLIDNSCSLENDIEEIIIKSLNVKKNVVEEDPNEKHLRKILNYGHTVGHAIESSGKFDSYLHGECVGIGMTYFSSEEVKEKINKFLDKYGLPKKVDISKDELYQYVCLDKKRNKEYLSIIFVSEVGKYEIKNIFTEEIKNYL